MWDWVSRLSLMLAIASGSACFVAKEDPWPPVRQPTMFEPPRICIADIQPPPFAEPVERPTEPQACLTGSWSKKPALLELSVVDGRVQDFHFVVTRPSRRVREGFLFFPTEEVSGPRYAVSPCPGHPAVWAFYLNLDAGTAGPAGATNALPEEPEAAEMNPVPCAADEQRATPGGRRDGERHERAAR